MNRLTSTAATGVTVSATSDCCIVLMRNPPEVLAQPRCADSSNNSGLGGALQELSCTTRPRQSAATGVAARATGWGVAGSFRNERAIQANATAATASSPSPALR